MASRLLWYGDDIKAWSRNMQEKALNETGLDCVAYAQQPGITPRKSSTLANSLRIEPAVPTGSGFVLYWGSFTVGYAIYVEMGTWKMQGFFYLRRTADAIYPTFPGRFAGYFS